MPGPKKEDLTDMYLHSAGVLGELLSEVKDTFAPAITGGLDTVATLGGTPGAPQAEPQPPPPPRKQKAQKDLVAKLYILPFPVAGAGESVTVYAEVFYKDRDANGNPVQWPYPDQWVSLLYQGQEHPGTGPYQMDLPDVQDYTVTLRAVVDTGKTVKLASNLVHAVCTAQLPKDAKLKDLACALYSEGGSRSTPPLDDKEMLAIAWAIRNRHDALDKAQQANDKRHWDYFAGNWYKDPQGTPYPFTATLSYRDLLRGRLQFTGVDGKEYNQCKEPLKEVPSIGACKRVEKCVELVNQVFVNGQPPDPYAGQGNPDYPGVFYYKEKGNTPPHKGKKLPELTGKDHHFYQGMPPDYSP